METEDGNDSVKNSEVLQKCASAGSGPCALWLRRRPASAARSPAAHPSLPPSQQRRPRTTGRPGPGEVFLPLQNNFQTKRTTDVTALPANCLTTRATEGTLRWDWIWRQTSEKQPRSATHGDSGTKHGRCSGASAGRGGGGTAPASGRPPSLPSGSHGPRRPPWHPLVLGSRVHRGQPRSLCSAQSPRSPRSQGTRRGAHPWEARAGR